MNYTTLLYLTLLILITAVVLAFLLFKEITSHDRTKEKLEDFKKLWETEHERAENWENRFCRLAFEGAGVKEENKL